MADPALYNAILEENKCIQTLIQTAAQEAIVAAAVAILNAEPFIPANWAVLPLLSNPTGCLCVLDTASGFLRCGANCTWTVPAGTSKVQFQIWGAGGGTGNGNCCSGSPYGSSGAYATVIIDAVAGCQYTLCAGCAYCCYGYCTTENVTYGCQSYVTGAGLTNFCAMGGTARISCGMKYLNNISQCRWRGPGTDNTQGPCICAGGNWYCFASSCSTCQVVPFIPDKEQIYYGTATTNTVLGMPAVFGGGCFDTNHYGYFTAPPMIGPCHTAQANSCRCETFSSGSCCGGCRCRAADGYRAFPGIGGTWTHMMGGSTEWSGDAGRGGMVRVSWC